MMVLRTSSIKRKRSRVSAKVRNTSRMRLSVFRSNRHFSVQVIDDLRGQTVASASTLEKTVKSITNRKVNAESVKVIAKLIVDRLNKLNFNLLYVFDRGFCAYKGNIKIFADQLRDYGLKF